MSAGVPTATRRDPRRRVLAAVLMSLAAGLCVAMLTRPQAAVAAAQAAPLISAGASSSCAIESGRAYCWGGNGAGQLGDGAGADSSVPVAVDTSGALAGKTLIQIAVSGGNLSNDGSTCALDSTGAAYCWGDNGDGQLGDGTAIGSGVPVAVDTSGALAGQTLTQITVGNGYACALASAGGAYCWGRNDTGQLGDGLTAGSSVPVAVAASGALAGKTLIQITAGAYHTCALDSTGAAYCWGSNDTGELGDGLTAGSGVPVAVSTSGALAGKLLTQITAGAYHTCALASTGAAYCWGYNEQGQLGASVGQVSSVPVAVDTSGALAGQTLTQITAGGYDACALDGTGTTYCWGDNSCGELGNGSASDGGIYCPVNPQTARYCRGHSSCGDLPVRPTGLLSSGDPLDSTVSRVLAGPLSQISGGLFSSCALDDHDAIYCWGDDTFGELGNDSTAQSDAPVLAVIPESGGITGPIVSGNRMTKCVDDEGGSSKNDTAVVISDCNGSPEQDWTVQADGTIQVAGKCLDIYRDGKANNARVELWTCTGGANQQWQARHGTLTNPVSGRCLDDPRFDTADGTQLRIYTCNGGANQLWKLP